MKISVWLNDLCYYYEKKRQEQEKFDEDEFKSIIESHRKQVVELNEVSTRKDYLKPSMRFRLTS